MISEQDVLIYTTKHWVKNATGISALDISEKRSLRHHRTKEIFKRLAKKGFGSVKENVELYTNKIIIDLENPCHDGTKRFKSRKVTTSIFFPSKSHLKEYYNSNILEFQSDGKYRNMLRLGSSQIELVYFKHFEQIYFQLSTK